MVTSQIPFFNTFQVIKDHDEDDVEITAYKRNIRRALRQRDTEELEEPMRKMRIGKRFQAVVTNQFVCNFMRI